MTIKTASFAYQYWDGLAMQFPHLAAVQRARLRAYRDWLQAVRAFRNGDGGPTPESNWELSRAGSDAGLDTGRLL